MKRILHTIDCKNPCTHKNSFRNKKKIQFKRIYYKYKILYITSLQSKTVCQPSSFADATNSTSILSASPNTNKPVKYSKNSTINLKK